MTESKIITKPFSHGDEVSKARNITGINKWARSSKTVGNIMLVLGWFTLPFEVLLRRDFGQRWFTIASYFTGLALVWFFVGVQSAYNSLAFHFSQTLSWMGDYNPFSNDVDARKKHADDTFSVILCAVLYTLMGLYHLFKIKWRKQWQLSLHSFDDGTSILTLPSQWLMRFLNAVSKPFLLFYWLMIPKKERQGKPAPLLISNAESFTNIFAEPGFVFLLGTLSSGPTALWFYGSAFSMMIFANWKEMARNTKSLDMEDSRLEAKMIRELHQNTSQPKAPAKKQLPSKATATLSVKPVKYPALNIIIEELHNAQSAIQPSAG